VVSIGAYGSATFSCQAVSDDSSVITYRWYHGDSPQPLIIDNRTYYANAHQLTVYTHTVTVTVTQCVF